MLMYKIGLARAKRAPVCEKSGTVFVLKVDWKEYAIPRKLYKYYVRKMSYQKGQEVLRCQPFTYVIYSNYRAIVCDYCLKYSKNVLVNDQDLKKCSACKKVYYCGILCQKKAWKSHHQDECAYLKSNLFQNHHWQRFSNLFPANIFLKFRFR